MSRSATSDFTAALGQAVQSLCLKHFCFEDSLRISGVLFLCLDSNQPEQFTVDLKCGAQPSTNRLVCISDGSISKIETSRNGIADASSGCFVENTEEDHSTTEELFLEEIVITKRNGVNTNLVVGNFETVGPLEQTSYDSSKDVPGENPPNSANPDSSKVFAQSNPSSDYVVSCKDLTEIDPLKNNFETVRIPEESSYNSSKNVSQSNPNSDYQDSRKDFKQSNSNVPSFKNVLTDRNLPLECDFATRHVILKCQHCMQTFFNIRALNRHVQNVHSSKKTYPCKICSMVCMSPFDLWHHQKAQHTKLKPLQCEDCHKCFPNENELLKHKTDFHSDLNQNALPHRCHICQKSFKHKNTLRVHVVTHSVGGLLSCDFCSESFKDHDDLIKHQQSHSKAKPFACGFCGASFAVKSYLRKHIQIHSKSRQFLCKFCGKSFNTKSKLRYHRLKMHTRIGQKYICDVCNKEFATGGSLKLHKSVHSDQKQFQCKLCDKSFRVKCTLDTHMTTHSELRMWPCDSCGKAFKTKTHLSTHKKRHLGIKSYVCSECDVSFVDIGGLRRHMKIHLKQKH